MTHAKNKARLDYFLITAGSVALAMVAASVIHRILPPANLSLVFLMPVLFAGVRYGLWPAFFAAFLGSAAYNFFFTEPRLTFNIYDYDDVATLAFFLLVAFVTGNMAVRLNNQIEALQLAAKKNALLSRDIEEARILAETERLRAALLSSVSHDLRTPLSTIIGSVTTLQDMGESLMPEARQELLSNVLEEAQRLNGFIRNLLDMTRLGHGDLKPKREWVEFRDILGLAIKRLQKELSSYELEIDIAPHCSTLFVDPVLLEQVMVNILENAVKYAPKQSRISISLTTRKKNIVRLVISDQGPGIPEGDRKLVFGMFYRVRAGDSKVAGTGLGLAICKGLVEVHDGHIYADVGLDDTGTSIVIEFPAGIAADVLERPDSEARAYG